MFYNGVLKTNDPDFIYMLRSFSIQKKYIDVDKEFDLLKDYIRYRLDYFHFNYMLSTFISMRAYQRYGLLPFGSYDTLLSFDEYKQQHD